MNERMQGGGGAGSDFGGVGGGGVTTSFNDLPTTWLSLKLGDVVAYGKTEKVEPEEIAPDTWVLELEDLEKDTTRVLQHLTFAERQSKSTKNKFNVGDVLYGKLRPYLNKVTFADQPGVCTTEIVPIKPNEAVYGRYLFYWLRHPAFLTYVTEVSHGVNMPRLGTDAGRGAPFVLAPKAEQKRIADKLDTVLTRVDAVNTRLARVAPLLKRFRQSVLAAATSGRLTEDSRGDLEQDWATHKLGDLLEGKPRNGYSPKAVDYETPVRSLTLSATTSGTFKGEHAKYIDEEIPDDSHLWLEPDDILIQRANSLEYVGVSAIFNGPEKSFIYPDLMMKARANTRTTSRFLHLLLCAEGTRKYFRENATGTAGNMPKINQQTVINAPCRLPTLAEQTEIVRRVETLFAFADRLEARLAQAQTAATRLTPALLAKAFRGELVPQDPNDEPAAELLRRLQAQRATAVSASKTGTGRGRGRTAVAAPAVTEN